MGMDVNSTVKRSVCETEVNWSTNSIDFEASAGEWVRGRVGGRRTAVLANGGGEPYRH